MAMLARRLAEHGRAPDVRLDECQGIHERAVDMCLGGEIDDRVSLRRERVDELHIADVAMHESVPRLPHELREVGQVAGVGQFVEDGDLDLRTGGPNQAHEVGADEPRGSCDQEAAERTANHLMGGPEVQSYPIAGSSCGILPSSSGAYTLEVM